MAYIKKFIYSLICFSLFLTPIVAAHGNIIYGINLDFDKELESNVIKSAQSYLKIKEEPIQFDFDKELIHVKFDRRLEYSVAINPVDNSVFGFRDDGLLNKDGKINYDKAERKEIAQKIFDSIPEEYKSELVYGEEKKLYSGSYKHTWYRYVDNIYVSGDHLVVEIDPSDGEVVAWRLSIFFYPKSRIKTTPAITYNVVQKIAEIRFKGDPIDFNPVLVINKDKLAWIVRVKSLYPIYVGVDASNGKVLYSGSLRDDLPEDYDYGGDVEVVETDFIKEIYNN